MGGDKAEEARRVIRKMRRLEIEKKYTFGLEKTKYMVMETGREVEEEIREEIERGRVGKTDEYKYVGLWLNKEADLRTHIEKIKKSIMGEVNEVRNMGSKEKVGPLYICTRLLLFEACIIPSLLHQIETWSPLLKKTELKQLESIQGKILCNLLQLPKTTPYWGILHETGTWTIRWRLVYKTIMLFHNIMVGDDDRLAKDVVIQQIKEGHKESFGNKVKEEAAAIGITNITELSKSELKKQVKESVKRRMEEEISREAEKSSKLRFLTQPITLECADYINELPGDEAVDVLKLRLNMVNIHGNYKGDITKKRWCPHCEERRDTTEHFITCSKIGGNEAGEEVLYTKDAVSWKGVMNEIRTNLERRN